MSRDDLVRLACAVGDQIRDLHALPQWREMVLRWSEEWLVLREAQLDYERRLREHATKAYHSDRLRDKNAGPPEKRWQIRTLVYYDEQHAWHPPFDAWVPPDLVAAEEPRAPFPLPLPDCELELPEKYAALAAIHDEASRGTHKIDPWQASDSERGWVTYHALRDVVRNLPKSDEEHLWGILGEIRNDLIWRGVSGSGASQRRTKEPDLSPKQPSGSKRARQPKRRKTPRARTRVGEGGRSVVWKGNSYSFTKLQGRCFLILYESWKRGTPDVPASTILSQANSDSARLVDVFGVRHPAWGTLIVKGTTRGTYRLTNPS